jgi:metallo-beta-lactamase class B
MTLPYCCQNSILYSQPADFSRFAFDRVITMQYNRTLGILLLTCTGASPQLHAATIEPDAAIHCDSCETWNQPQAPFRIYGNTYYVGVAGLSAVLVTSKDGHVLLDGNLPQSAKLIGENIQALGFRIEDIRYIVNSHVHYDHAGGIAALQRASGAVVAASPASAIALKVGALQPDDPQYGFGRKETSFPAVKQVRILANGEVLRVGDIAVTAHFTPGHTPGGTTWTWKSCEQSKCVDIVYADSLNAISADGFRFSDSPKLVQSLRHSISIVANLPCDIMIPVHPESADIQGKSARMKAGAKENLFIDTQACKYYAAAATARLNKRLSDEHH